MLRRALLLAFLVSLPAFAGDRSIRRLDGAIEAAQFVPELPETTAVAGLKIHLQPDGTRLDWEPSPRYPGRVGPSLTEYLILAGSSPDHLNPVRSVAAPGCLIPSNSPASFFAVRAIYAGACGDHRRPRYAGRDENILLDFEEGDFTLDSYSDQEDIEPEAWEISDDEAYPPSNHSLKLFGNTWKRMLFNRRDLTEASVWTVAVMPVDGDTSAQIQAFGVGDGARELIYTFAGRRTVWAEGWNIANQEARTRGRWQLWRLAIGYDWKVRYGYLPSIDELIFINDNDENDPAALLYIDEIADVTGDLLPEPQPKARWRVDPTADGPGTAVRFFATVDNRGEEELALRWDFGDGFYGSGFSPLHFYGRDGAYRVGLEARDDAGLVGRTSLVVEAGAIRTPNAISLAFGGDVMLARRYEADGGLIRMRGPEAVFERIQDRTASADIFHVNLECPLTDEGVRHPTKDIYFRGRPENVAGLVYAGVDVVSLANNHVGDYQRRGMEETAEVLDAAGILRHGAGMTEYEALQPVLKTVRGLRVGYLGYCNRTGRDYNSRPYLDAGYDREGYAYFSGDNLVRSVPDAAALCDLLVVVVHGGTEYDVVPQAAPGGFPAWSEEVLKFDAHVDSATRELEHLAIDLGAGLVIGHHPHVQQGYEIYRGVVIAHSLGNFAFDQNFWETWPSVIVRAELTHEGITSVEIEPIFVDSYQPTPATGFLGARILDRLAGYSTPLNATVIPDYARMRAAIALEPDEVVRSYSSREASLTMRYIEADDVWRSEPLGFAGAGFPVEVSSVSPAGLNSEWKVRLGRDILLVGNMEREGAAVWNYNSIFEGRDSNTVFRGSYSSLLRRNAGQGDAVTDLIQRIPVSVNDRLTLDGRLRITNGRNAGLAARWYLYRYDNQPENIRGDSTAGSRISGDSDWERIWGELTVPEGVYFANIRWQLYAPQNGTGTLWTDDVALIRWDEWNRFDEPVPVDYPSDLCYLQLECRRPVESVTVRFRTVTLSY